MLTSLYPHSNKLLAYKLQSIHPKQNQQQITYVWKQFIMHASNWKKKPLEVLKRIKPTNVKIEDKFTMGIRWGKLTISFCKKFFSCINIFNYLTLSWRSRFCKSMTWFLYDNGLRHERVNDVLMKCNDARDWVSQTYLQCVPNVLESYYFV